MSILQSLTSPLFLIIIIASIKLSGNDKAPFLIALPFFYSILLSSIYLFFLIKSSRQGIENINKTYISLLISSIPLVYIGLVMILARKGIIDSYLFLGFR